MNPLFISNLLNKNINLTYHLVVIVFFSILYYVLAITGLAADEEDERFDSLGNCVYYTIVTHFTIGYGDISPKTPLYKTICCLQIFIAFMLTNL